jgi:hypothetical protein
MDVFLMIIKGKILYISTRFFQLLSLPQIVCRNIASYGSANALAIEGENFRNAAFVPSYGCKFVNVKTWTENYPRPPLQLCLIRSERVEALKLNLATLSAV